MDLLRCGMQKEEPGKKIFLINVGANTAERGHAKSPIFNDKKWVYVPFSKKTNNRSYCKEYPSEARPFTHTRKGYRVHCDPDWDHLTYGDWCPNARAGALKDASIGDILLFWGLLWHNGGKNWDTFEKTCGWYLFGAIRIAKIVVGGPQFRKGLTRGDWARAKKNAHMYKNDLGAGNRIFIGSLRRSQCFEKAVPFYAEGVKLLFHSVTTKDGHRLRSDGPPRWYCSTRGCRAVWKLESKKDRSRARSVRDAIKRCNKFDLMAGL